MNRRQFLGLSLSAGAAGYAVTAYGVAPERPIDLESVRTALQGEVAKLPASRAKRISNALLADETVMLYIDENGYPAARWRGIDMLGACVHLRKGTLEPYLETQYNDTERPTKAPKYIQFGHAGPWYSRRHNGVDKFLGTEKNWIDANSQAEATALLGQLEAAFGLSPWAVPGDAETAG